jgi:hypothetical protein
MGGKKGREGGRAKAGRWWLERFKDEERRTAEL